MREYGFIYLLHFDQPISEFHTTQHYLGWCKDIGFRMEDHREGRGARLTQVALERGIEFRVVRTWWGTREDERRLKNRKEGPCLCPVCNPDAERRAAKL